MEVTNRTDQTLVLPKLGLVAEPGETIAVPDDVAASLIDQGWSPVAKKQAGKVADVKDGD